MDLEETMVEQEDTSVADDTLPEEVVEEPEEPASESLESLISGEGQPAEEAPAQPQGSSEPGYIKKRVEKAVQKAVAETESRMRAEFEAQMAPIREKMLNDEAKDLVRQGLVKDLETAKELVRYRQNIPAPQPKEEQPRNEQGQYAPKDDPVTTTRINMLTHQADKLKAQGVDVIAEFKNNAEVKEKIISGEIDFYDVADMIRSPKRKPPAPMRSPNGASGKNPNAIDSMSDEQFERMERNISERGARYSLR